MISSIIFWITTFWYLSFVFIPKAEPAVYSNLVINETLTINSDFSYDRVIEKKLRIHSKDGLEHAATAIFYDKLNEIKDFELEMTDALTGKSLKKSKLKDMGDAALFSSSSFFDDNRYKFIELNAINFPVDVTVRIHTFSKSNFFLPTWVPVPFYHQKVDKSVFQVRYPKELGIKYKGINIPNEPLLSQLEGLEIMEWKLENLPVQTPDLEEEKDYKLILAPIKFSLDRYRGEMDDWEGLAKWQDQLNKGRDELPKPFQSKLIEMVSGTTNDYEKIKVLYEYLQKNFRYVSIQLGIGGWQTMKATDVLSYSYGDCKGLTNLMRSMLHAVGITSHYTLVYAGVDAKDIQVDFPSNQFNHVILYVPTEKSPIWLECTSNSLPAGFLGDFTKNRHVLVTMPEGGFLTKTPSYSSEEWNTITTKSTAVLDKNGDAKIGSQITQTGNFAETLLFLKDHKDEREQKEFLVNSFSVPGLVINELTLDVNDKDSLLLADISLDGYVQRFVQQTSKRIIVKPFMGKITLSKLANGYLHQFDEVEIKLPEVLSSDGNLPMLEIEEENLKGSFTAELDGDRLYLKRELFLTIPKDWSKTQKTEFLKKVNGSFEKSIFLSKTPPSITSN